MEKLIFSVELNRSPKHLKQTRFVIPQTLESPVWKARFLHFRHFSLGFECIFKDKEVKEESA